MSLNFSANSFLVCVKVMKKFTSYNSEFLSSFPNEEAVGTEHSKTVVLIEENGKDNFNVNI